MAKSTRSKVKRAFRAKKRDEGVYAATEAARLHRLHQKLKMIASTDAEGDVPVDDADAEGEGDKLVQEGGSYLCLCLGLVDHQDITPEVMERVAHSSSFLFRES